MKNTLVKMNSLDPWTLYGSSTGKIERSEEVGDMPAAVSYCMTTKTKLFRRFSGRN